MGHISESLSASGLGVSVPIHAYRIRPPQKDTDALVWSAQFKRIRTETTLVVHSSHHYAEFEGKWKFVDFEGNVDQFLKDQSKLFAPKVTRKVVPERILQDHRDCAVSR